jgi:hypothetical protein
MYVQTSNHFESTFYLKPFSKNLDDDFYIPVTFKILEEPSVQKQLENATNIKP